MQTGDYDVNPRSENPWWDSGDVSDSEYYSEERRSDFEYKLDHVQSSRFVALAGAAGSGKTTMLHQIVHELIDDGVPPQNVMYLPLGNPRFQIGEGVIREAVNEFATYYWRRDADPRQGYVLVDDAHASTRWSEQVRASLEQFETLTIAVTLPTLARAQTDSIESLGVETEQDVLLPTKFYDYVTEELDVRLDKDARYDVRDALAHAVTTGESERLHSSIAALESSVVDVNRVQRAVMDYIRGSHREVLGSTVGVNMELTVFRDIPRYQQFDDRNDLQALCVIAAMNPGQTLGLKDLSEVLACDRRTLQRYIDILEDFFLLTPSYQYEHERRRSVRLYLRDPLLLGSLLDIDLTGLLSNDAERRLTTVTVFDHLKRLGFSYLNHNAEVQFWESGGVSVDYVIETDDGTPIPFVTESTSGERAPTNRIETFCSEHDCEFGVRIGRDVDPSIEGNVVALPFWLFLLFI